MTRHHIMAIPLYIPALVGIVFVLFSVGCKSNEGVVGEEGGDSPAFELVVGEGGGFTGRYEGFSVSRDGALWSWEGRYAEDGPERLRALDEQERRAIWRMLQEGDFFEMNLTERTNYSMFIRVSTQDTSRQLMWMPDEGDEAKVPAQNLYHALIELLETYTQGH